ncbi:MAG: Prophage regulatory [Proteobacteria bacterium]|nr:Prophage regulatory [Pseudomonadota bacterium]
MSNSTNLYQRALVNFDQLPGSAYVRLPVVLSLFPCSRATFWRWVKSGRVPAPKKMGDRISVWSVDEIRQTLKKIETAELVNGSSAN